MAEASGTNQGERLIFLVGAPRSGTTLLQRMLQRHPDIGSHPEPHLVTPLAHLGVWANVERAPYDHINAAEAQRQFVAALPGGEQDYWAACRAYLDILYGRMLDKLGTRYFLDKTPAYALVLPFLVKVYPRARYLVLTRHPLAVFCSYANSFFEGDAEQAVAFNDILGRYLPAIAEFLRRPDIEKHHLRYERLVQEPERELAGCFDFLALPDHPQAVEYGAEQGPAGGYGDPKVRHHTRPTADSLEAWAADLAADEGKRRLAERVLAPIAPADIAAWGYNKRRLFEPLGRAAGKKSEPSLRWRLDSYRLQRKVFLGLRRNIHRNRLGRLVRRVRYYCDVLLRE